MLKYIFILLLSATSLYVNAEVYSLPTEKIIAASENLPFRASLQPVHTKSWDQFTIDHTKWDDFLNNIPGVVARDYGSPTISIRGSQQLGRVLQLYNDIPLNGPDGFGASRLFITKETTDKIQLLKGPSSVFYGTQALAGSINFSSEKIQNSKLKLSLGNYGNVFDNGNSLSNYSVSLRTPFIKSNNNYWEASFLMEKDQGNYKFDNARVSKPGQRENNASDLARFSLQGQQTFDKLKIEENILLSKSFRQLPGSITTPFLSLEDSGGHVISLKTEYKFSDTFKWNTQSSSVETNALYDKNTSAETNLKNTRFFILQNLTMDYYTWMSAKVYLDFYHDRFASSYAGTGEFVRDTLEFAKVFDFFIDDNWSLQTGSRYSFQDKKTTTSVVAKYKSLIDESWLSFSQGYRRASLTDLYSNTNFFQSNPNLKIESSDQFELGYKTTKNPSLDGFNFLADAFIVRYKDAFLTIPISTTSSTRINSGDQDNWGTDLEFSYRQGPWNWSLQHAFIQSLRGETLRLTPKHSFKISTSHQIGSIVFYLSYDYWSDYYDLEFGNTELTSLSGWKNLDFSISTFGFNDFRIDLGIRNILDAQFERTLGYPEPGRRLYLTMYRFF